MQEGKKALRRPLEAGQPVPGLLNYLTASQIEVWMGREFRVKCVTSSSLLGRKRATYRETRTNLRVVWIFTPDRACYFYWAHYHLGKVQESTWPCDPHLRGHVNLGKPLPSLGFYMCKKG